MVVSAPGQQDNGHDSDLVQRLHTLRRWATWLDSQFVIPGTSIRVGLDALVGLVPVVGDVLGLAAGLAIVAEGRRLGVSWGVVMRMLLNLGLDWLVGSVPVVGDVVDVGLRPNLANVALIEQAVLGVSP